MQLELAQNDVSVAAADDRYMRSDDGSMSTDRSAPTMHRRKSGHIPRRHIKFDGQQPTSSVNYHGTDIYQAAADGNLPLCVLLWGMATAKRINLMDPDSLGNTPMHYAALADLPEVMGFFLKQGRHRNNQDNRLLDLRNALGETPLLRASTVGKIPSLKFLLDEGADPFCSDHLGNTVFINLARFGRIWGLHFVYSTLCDKFGYECASQLLVASDVSDNNALDWAADSGEVNIIEYLMRRNINPLRTNYNGRSALHIAAKYGRLEAARFLVKCGCDPFQRSSDNESPMSLAAASNNREIISVLNRKSDSGKRDHTRQSKFSSKSRMRSASPDLGSLVGIPGGHQTPGQVELECNNSNIAKKMNASNEFANINDRDGGVAVMPSLLRDPDPGLSLYVVDKRGSRRPHAIFRLRPSRIEFALFYGLMVAGYWILAICIRFYVWVILVVVSVLLFRHIEMKLQVAEADKRSNHTNTGMGRTRFQELILAPEKYLGVYIGMTMTCLLYWLCSLRIGVNSDFISSSDTAGLGSVYMENLKNRDLAFPPLGIEFLDIGGLSGSTDDTALFWAVFICLITACMGWCQLTWFSTDPGAIYSRYEDFDMIMDQCLTSLAPASGQLYCRTSMVKKPLRSKYCSQTGFVIARMDHFCVWLNNSVGHGNHRTFMAFLLCQFTATTLYSAMLIRALHREMGENPTACWALSHLFDRLYFLPTVLCATLIAISLTLGALLFEQSYNILKNITTNERLNGSRYPWMTDNLGNPFNRFDRGFANNFLEFWCAPGYCKDYYNEFGDPPPPKSIESFELLPLVSGGNLNLSMRRDSVDSNMSGLDPLKGRSDAFSPPVPNLHHSDSASACDYEHPLQSFPRFRQFPTYPTTHMTKPLSYDQSGLVSPSDLFVQEDPAFVGVQNGFSILTRAQEAQLQFEARVQHAIEMSHSPRDAHTDGGLESPTSSGPPQDGGSLHWGHIPKHDSDMFKEPIRGSGSGDALRSISAVSQDELTNVFSHQLLLSKGNNTQQNFAVHSREMHQPHPMSISAVEIALGPDSNPHTPVPPRRYGSSGSAEGRSFERSLLQTERPSTTPTYLPHQEKKHFRAPIVDDNSSLGPQGAAATVFTQLQPGGDRAERSADLCKITDSQRHFLTDDGQEGHFVGKEG